MAINNIGINTQSFGVQRQSSAQNTGAQNEVQHSVNDGFQASGLTANPEANPAAAGGPAEVTLTVTPSQLASQAFQSTLASLSASGIPVSVVMVAEGSQQATPAPSQPTQAPIQQNTSGFNVAGNPAPAPQPAYTPPPRHQTPRYGGD
ncbi:hypothetical protein JST97_32740 [bacterium]|nr:hypothetical protein [bacterium]